MSKARLVITNCDFTNCTNEMRVHERPTIKVTLANAGWAEWKRGTSVWHVCPEHDTLLTDTLHGSEPKKVRRARKPAQPTA